MKFTSSIRTAASKQNDNGRVLQLKKLDSNIRIMDTSGLVRYRILRSNKKIIVLVFFNSITINCDSVVLVFLRKCFRWSCRALAMRAVILAERGQRKLFASDFLFILKTTEKQNETKTDVINGPKVSQIFPLIAIYTTNLNNRYKPRKEIMPSLSEQDRMKRDMKA